MGGDKGCNNAPRTTARNDSRHAVCFHQSLNNPNMVHA